MSVDYVAKRFGALVLVIVVAVTLNFLVPRLNPANPIEARMYELAAQGGVSTGDMKAMIAAYNQKFGFDQPLWLQYVRYWRQLFVGNLGVSVANFPEKVTTELARALPWTIGLLLTATVLSFSIGSLLGALMAWRVSRIAEIAVPLFMALSAIPFYLLGIALIFILAVIWAVLPSGGAYGFQYTLGLNWAVIGSILKHSILPAFSIVLGGIGLWGLGMRGMMITTMGEDYMKMAEFKGLSGARRFFLYGLRNAILPQTTALAINLAHLMGGAVLVEVVFDYPGVGNLLYQAIQQNDYFVIQGVVLLVIIAVAVGLFFLDVAYPLIDPRIRYQQS